MPSPRPGWLPSPISPAIDLPAGPPQWIRYTRCEQSSSTKVLVLLPELWPGHARAIADEYVRVILAFLVLNAIGIAVLPSEPARSKGFVCGLAREADHD